MSDVQPDPSWWQASDDKWYPPELHPSVTDPEPEPAAEPPPADEPSAVEPLAEEPPGPTVIGTPGTGAAEVAERVRRGTEGEEATHDALTALPSSYRVAHGLKMGTSKADIDHVVIGPSGVWVIDSKNWSGSLTAGKGTLWRGRTPIRREVASLEKQAAYARAVLGLDTNPMLCFIATRLPRPAQMVGRCRVVSLDVLVPYLESHPSVLTPEEVDAAFRKVEAWAIKPPAVEVPGPKSPRTARARPAAVAGPTRGTSSRSGRKTTRPRPTPASARRPKASSSTNWGAVVFGVLGLIAIMAFLSSPGLMESAADRIWEVFTPTTDPPVVVVGASTTVADSASASVPTTAPNPNLFTAGVSCPVPGGDFTIEGRAAMLWTERIRVSATVEGGEPQFLGELSSFQALEPITGLASNQTVRFDIESVDRTGETLASYDIDVVTPQAPC